MKCQQARLEKDFTELGAIGCLEGGGYSRIAFTEEDLAARKWLQQAMLDAGLEVSQDAVGNISGRRSGSSKLPPVMLGSHLDTVPEGGNYDGVVGVLAALEVVRSLNDNKVITKRPIEVINFSAEESCRFGLGTIGSKAVAGKLTIDNLKKLTDQKNTSLYQVLNNLSYDHDNIVNTDSCLKEVHSFIELHIEQGPVLEMNSCPIGIVTAIAAPTRFKVIIEGQADHSGNTPMSIRKDALVAASELVLGVERITNARAGKKTVGTVGYLNVSPGAMNVVPGRVELGIDIRDVNVSDKNRAVHAVINLMAQIADQRELNISYEILCDDEPVSLSDKIIATLKKSASEANLRYMQMPSGAGHDAMNMAQITDAGLIFIPSVGGVSHNTTEFSRMEDIRLGTELLLAATINLAQE